MDIHFGVERFENAHNFGVVGTGIRGVWQVSPSTLLAYILVYQVQFIHYSRVKYRRIILLSISFVNSYKLSLSQ